MTSQYLTKWKTLLRFDSNFLRVQINAKMMILSQCFWELYLTILNDAYGEWLKKMFKDGLCLRRCVSKGGLCPRAVFHVQGRVVSSDGQCQMPVCVKGLAYPRTIGPRAFVFKDGRVQGRFMSNVGFNSRPVSKDVVLKWNSRRFFDEVCHFWNIYSKNVHSKLIKSKENDIFRL